MVVSLAVGSGVVFTVDLISQTNARDQRGPRKIWLAVETLTASAALRGYLAIGAIAHIREPSQKVS
jgi:hypothetical protein